MTYLVPFDGSGLAKAALARARMYAIAINEAPPGIRDELRRDGPIEVVALSIVPEGAGYAREKGWLPEGASFDVRTVVETLRRTVADIDPGADFQFERVDGGATAGTISNRIRRRARAADVSVVFVGSENAGRIITPITSVGGVVAADRDYDVHIIRRTLPTETRERLKSTFFAVD